MTTHSKPPDPEGEKPPSFGIGKFLFVFLLALIFFLLVHSMVHHRFFRGGRVNRHGSIVQKQALKKSWSPLRIMPSYVFVGVKVLCERLTPPSRADVA